jgi:hypothetical protein
VTVDVHFVQAGDGPILIGSGGGTLACPCGHTLVQGFEAAGFLAIGIQCARCGTITTTESLPDGSLPPRSAIVAAPSMEPRTTAMTVPPGVPVVGQAEMARLRERVEPATPDHVYHLSLALLDDAAAAFERHTGAALPPVASGEAFDGLRDHALAWAVRHLRGRMQAGPWACSEDAPASIATILVTGFLHFVATWSRHPLFPAMVTTAADRGFSPHGLAPFAAAHCLVMMGNRIRFPEPLTYPGRIEGFGIVAGGDGEAGRDGGMVAGGEPAGVRIEVFDRVEFPFGHPWDGDVLRAAVSDALGTAQGQINLRNPGMLVLSPGNALAGYDEALIEAMKAGVQSIGRKNRGLMALALLTLRLQTLPDPHAVRFVYGFFPIGNRHYRGESLVRMGG